MSCNFKMFEIMKMRIFFPVLALVAMISAGCVKETITEPVNEPQQGKTVLTAGIETKTVLQEDKTVLWTDGDVINVNGVASGALDLEEPSATASFVFDGVLGTPYNAVFPASIYKNESTVTLPSYQSYTAGSFSKSAAPMAAQSDNNALVFQHLCAVIKLTVNCPSDSVHDDIEYVDFYGKNGEQVSGDFSIDFSTLALAGVSNADADKKIRYKVSKKFVDGSLSMYFVVPAQNYANGYTFKLIDSKGHYMEVSKQSAQELVAGTLCDMPAFDFVPTGTDLDVEIASAQDLIKFATDYNAGEYADEDLLVVNLSQDIVFDAETSAAYAATGGIGTAATDADGNTNYFSGVFDGQGFSIKNWNSTCPLFAYTSADGVVENLTIDASCTLTANYAGNSPYYGAFVGYHRGLLTNCHVNADLVGSGSWEAEPHIGALAGRVVVGTIENCTVNGDVTFDNTLVTSGKNSYFGGAVGRVSNSAGELKGISVTGNVSLSAGSTYKSSNANDASVYYGGVVGMLAGTCTDCHLTEATKKFFYGNYVYDGGATNIVNNHYRNQYVGGIAGSVEEGGALSNCNNYAAVVLNQYNGDVDGTNSDISRYLYAGGIAGYIKDQVSNCTMYGSLANRSSCLQQFIGGVVGNVQASGSVHYCANEGEALAAGTAGAGYYQARNNNIGGVIGTTYSTDLSNLTNRADLNCSRMNSKNSATLSMGGVIGKVEAASGEIDGKGVIVNFATIVSSHEQYENQYTAIGGVIGETKCSVKGVVNEGSANYIIGEDGAVYKHIWVGGVVGYANGELTLTSLDNKGTAFINISKSIDKQHFDLCVGGVLGTNADAKAVALVDCVNSGSAAFQGGGTKTNGRSIALGGIVGALTNGGSSISGCSNTGCISNTSSNNKTSAWVIRSAGGSNYVGGIAGYIEGAEGDLLEVTNCVNNRTAGTDDKVGNGSYAIYTLRGSAGALVGGAKYGDVKNGTVTTYIYNTNSTVTGSVVGSITNSNISNCVATNCTLNPHTGCAACGGCVGETVASTIADITLNGITILEPSATTTGAIAGKSDATSTFTNIKLKGQIGNASISASSTMIATDGGATVTGTYLLD